MSPLGSTLTAIVIGAATGLVGFAVAEGMALAADLPISHVEKNRAHSPGNAGAESTRLEDFALKPANLNCTAWTDGCRSCGKSADGVHCSNVGIACQSSAPHCTQP